MYAGANLTYRYPIIIAIGRKAGTSTTITPKLEMKVRAPESAARAELFKAPNMYNERLW